MKVLGNLCLSRRVMRRGTVATDVLLAFPAKGKILAADTVLFLALSTFSGFLAVFAVP